MPQIHCHIDEGSDPLSRALFELETTKAEFSSLYYAVSHDLSAPVRSIIGFSKALEEDYGEQIPAPQREYLVRIISNASKLQLMIGKLLFLSRIPDLPIHIEPVNMSNLVNKVFDALQVAHTGRAVRREVEDNIIVHTDPDIVQRVIEALAENAWKFSKADTPLEVKFGIDRDAPPITCYIRDNGIGFDATFADKLFSPFQKLHADSAVIGEPGLGVGLAAVHRLIRHLNGRVWAEAEPNRGAAFFFALPEYSAPIQN